MEESSTDVKQAVDAAIKEAVSQVRKFTKTQLKNLIRAPDNKKPLIIPIGQDGYVIGNYAIKIYKNYWYVKYFYDDREIVFANRQAALFYALSQHKRRYALADSILQYDQDIERLEIESNLFQLLLSKAKKNKNQSSAAIYSSRLVEVKHLLNIKRNLLAKSLKTAKYYYL